MHPSEQYTSARDVRLAPMHESQKALGAVFEDLFDADGAEIYLKDASTYVATGESVDFFTVVEAARRRGEIAIGYDIAGKTGARAPKLMQKPRHLQLKH